MGELYPASTIRADRKVALKLLRVRACGDSAAGCGGIARGAGPSPAVATQRVTVYDVGVRSRPVLHRHAVSLRPTLAIGSRPTASGPESVNIFSRPGRGWLAAHGQGSRASRTHARERWQRRPSNVRFMDFGRRAVVDRSRTASATTATAANGDGDGGTPTPAATSVAAGRRGGRRPGFAPRSSRAPPAAGSRGRTSRRRRTQTER